MGGGGGIGKVLGSVVNMSEGNRQAGMIGRAARQTEAAFKEVSQFARDTQERAFKEAGATPQEIRALEGSLAAQERNVAAEEKLLSAIDPQILEAGSQALGILQGKDTGVDRLGRRDRERQRQELLNTLREQLGPGAETSSVGQQALQKFDSETGNLLEGRRQGQLSQLLGLQTSLGSMALNSRGLAANRLAATAPGFRQIQQDKIGALLNPLGVAVGAGQAAAGQAGANQVGSILRSQNMATSFNNIAGSIGSMGGGAGGGGGNPGGGLSSMFGSVLGE